MFTNPFSFEGRIRRTEYGITMIIYVVAAVIIQLIAEATSDVVLLLFIPLIWMLWAQGTKRCHDRNNSAWWQLIPFYGFVMLFGDGNAYSNEYGADPKGRGDLLEQLLPEELV